MVAFKKAERKQVKLKIAISGPSGSGKTFSSLEMSKGIGKRIALVDTENKSASLYSDRFDFDTLEIDPPYTTDKYLKAIKAAVDAGYDVLIIDSLSHAWAGEGGLLAKKGALDARGGNNYTNWAPITIEQEALMSAIQNANIHLIVTLRSKQEYVLEVNDKGKQAPRKVGLAPIQRDGTEYLFTTVFDCAMDHHASVSKDRTSLFDGKLFKITQDTGKLFMDWLASGKPMTPAESAPATQPEQKPAPEAPKPSPLAAPESIDVPCSVCGAMLVLHASKAGYLCPKSTKKDDGHTRFAVGKLAEFRARSKTMNAEVETDVN